MTRLWLSRVRLAVNGWREGAEYDYKEFMVFGCQFTEYQYAANSIYYRSRRLAAAIYPESAQFLGPCPDHDYAESNR